MTSNPDIPSDRALLAAALAFQQEGGADEAIGEAPVDRFAAFAAERAAREQPAASPAQRPSAGADAHMGTQTQGSQGSQGFKAGADAPVAAGGAAGGASAHAAGHAAGHAAIPSDAGRMAGAAGDLAALAAAAEAYDAPEALALKAGATRFVFADGRPRARLMIVGEAPGQEEDRQGRPFVGRAGQLLDRMLAAIGLDRQADDPARAAYIANILPWRPPGNRTPTEAEAAAFLPFIERHIALAAPEVLLLLGNTPLRALTGQTGGITRARGQWRRHAPTGVEMIASFHPAYLLRMPAKKREAWADLLEIAARLDL